MRMGQQLIAPKDGSGGGRVATKVVVATFAPPPPSSGAINCCPLPRQFLSLIVNVHEGLMYPHSSVKKHNYSPYRNSGS